MEGICHTLLKLGVGDHLHGNGLVAAEDVHAVQVAIEKCEIFRPVCVRTDEHGSQHNAAGLARLFDRVAGALHLAAAVFCQGQILLAFAVRDMKSIGCEGNGNDKDMDKAIRVPLSGSACKKLQGIAAVSTANGNIGLHNGRLCLCELNVESCH